MTTTLDRAYALLGDGASVQVDRGVRGLLRLTGEQRIWFLQNTITNDVEDVPAGRWVESCFLEVKGHVVAHFRVGVLDDEVWLDVDPPATADLVDWFVRNRFRTKVEVEDVSAPCVTTIGPAALALAADGVIAAGPVFGGTLRGLPTADAFAPPSGDLPVAGEDLYEVLRVEAGLARFGVDYGPANLPQEAGLTRVVSVTKGCYIGQEVMARLHFRGHANRTVRPVAFPDASTPDGLVGRQLVRGDERVGAVSSAVSSPGMGTIGIAMVRLAVDEGEAVEVAGAGRAIVGAVPEGTKRVPERVPD